MCTKCRRRLISWVLRRKKELGICVRNRRTAKAKAPPTLGEVPPPPTSCAGTVGSHRAPPPLCDFGGAPLPKPWTPGGPTGPAGRPLVFKWKGKSCPDCEASSCWLDHGDLLVMGGRCQDEFLHCTDPGLEQERINVTFRCRWIKQHVASCPFLKTAVACCLPTCAQGSSVSVTEFVGYGAAWDSCCSQGCSSEKY